MNGGLPGSRGNCNLIQSGSFVSCKDSPKSVRRLGQGFEREDGGLGKTSPSNKRKLTSICAHIHNRAAINLLKHWLMLECGCHAKA
jgi:hypothetical protein